MPSKKVKFGIIAVVIVGIVISGFALFPVFLYGGFTVNTAEVNMGVQVSEGSTSLSSTPVSTTSTANSAQWTGTDTGTNVSERSMNVYQYMFSKANDITQVTDHGTNSSAIVNIQITFNLTTPSNRSLIFTFNPHNLKGEGLKNIKVLLGPDQLNRESGTFHLRINIIISINPPDPLHDKTIDLTPVNLSFTIPK
ncbi:MAG: hypothetical protein P8Y70_17935 [Candidatus Lokiarchaeota archaeon]